MYKWLTKLIADLTGKTMRDEYLRKDAERKEQESLAREAMLARARATTRPYGSYPSYRSSPVRSTTTTTHQPDNTALHLGMMAMAMSEPSKPVDSCSRSSYSSSNDDTCRSSSYSSSYDSGSSSYDSGSSSSSSFD